MRGVEVTVSNLNIGRKHIHPSTIERYDHFIDHSGYRFCYSITFNKEKVFFFWSINREKYDKLVKEEYKETVQEAMKLLITYFFKSQQKINLRLEEYHQNAIFLTTNRNTNFYQIHYLAHEKIIDCTFKYIIDTVNILLYKQHMTHTQKKELIHICDQFSSALAHECEHGLLYVKSKAKQLQHEIITEGIAVLTEYINSESHLFTGNKFSDALQHTYTYITHNKEIKNKERKIGFYLYSIFFVYYVNQKFKEQSPFKKFATHSFKEQIHILKRLKQIMKKHLGKEILRDVHIQLREQTYKLQERQIKFILSTAEKKLTKTNLSEQFL